MSKRNHYKLGRTCGCGAPIFDGSVSGRCKVCNARNLMTPENRAKAGASHRRRHREDPEFHERMAKIGRRNMEKAVADPAIRAKLSANGKKRIKDLWSPECRAKWMKSRPAAIAKRLETIYAWCPYEDLREEYRRLIYNPRNGILSAEAKEIIGRKVEDRMAVTSPHFHDALRWLGRIAPVTLQEDGTYRYGNAFLRPAEVMSRAKLKGWEPERLAA